MFDRLATEEELERLILRVHDNLGMKAPAVIFRIPPGSTNGDGKEYGAKIPVGEYHRGPGKMKTIYLPMREWVEEYRIFDDPQCYVAMALHECVHSTTKEQRHTVDFFYNLFCLCAEYGPKEPDLRRSFIFHAFWDEVPYYPKRVGKAWSKFWKMYQEI